MHLNKRQLKGGTSEMNRKMAGLVTALLLTTAGTAIAEQRAGALTLSPFVGGYTFDGVQRLETRPVYGLRLGYDITKNLGVEATFDYVNTKNTSNVTPPGGQIKNNPNSNLNVYNYRLEGIYNFMPANKFVPFVAIGGGGSTITNRKNGEKSNNDATANAGVGFKYFLTEDLALRADTRAIMSFHHNIDFKGGGDTWLNYEYTLGVQFLFGGKKPLVAKVVEAPPAPVVAPKAVLPPPPPPVVAPVVDGKVGAWSDWSACSAPCGGGNQSRTRNVEVQPANGGAPLPALSETRGCNVQACMEEGKINLLIEFDFDKAVVKKEFYPNADAVGAFMKKNDKLVITVDGWTDKIGTEKYNKALSQKRADAVKAYLVSKHKIDPSRITAVGHGKSLKYDNKTEVGRYKNRRVEMNQTVMVEKK
jgi:OmpA-OmpF porin, OOP family